MALTEWVHATCGLFEVEISRRTNKDGKYIEGNTIKVDIASDIAIVFFEFFLIKGIWQYIFILAYRQEHLK